MKIAVATEGAMVAEHFGRCREYTIAEIQDGKLASKVVIPSPGHEPGFLPRYLAGMDVHCVIAGGMGVKAQNLFREAGIKTVVGVTGLVDRVIDDFIGGRLVGGESFCDHSGHGYGCGGGCGHEDHH
ncbi:MAG: NifB/NifX family molybdenum-iron cluster-binding protein [Bacillota bacterium]